MRKLFASLLLVLGLSVPAVGSVNVNIDVLDDGNALTIRGVPIEDTTGQTVSASWGLGFNAATDSLIWINFATGSQTLAGFMGFASLGYFDTTTAFTNDSLFVKLADSSGKALQDASGNIILTTYLQNDGDTLTYVVFTPGSASYEEGLLYYDSGENALSYYNDEADVTMNIGREMWIRVRNITGTTIDDGKVVYVTGATGNLPQITLADADVEASSSVLGVATHSIENNTNGYITVFGIVRGINTSSFSEGETIYLSQTPGEFTATPPISPAHVVEIGVVCNAGVSGAILVHLGHSKTLSSLADVLLTGPSLGDFLLYNGTTWVDSADIGFFTKYTRAAPDDTGLVYLVPGAGDTLLNMFVSNDDWIYLDTDRSSVDFSTGDGSFLQISDNKLLTDTVSAIGIILAGNTFVRDIDGLGLIINTFVLEVDTATLNSSWKIATTSLADVATSANGIKTVVVNSTPTGAGDDQKVLTYFNTGDTLGWKTPPGAGGGSEDSLIFNESESATGTEYSIVNNLIKRRPGVGIDFVREDSTTFDLLRTSVDTAFLNANWEIATATSAAGIKTVAVNSTPTGAGDDQKVLTYFNTGDTLGWKAPPGAGGGSEDSLIINESESAAGTEYAIMSNLLKIRPGEGIDITREDSSTFDVLRFSAEDATSANKGIASFNVANFAVTAGDVIIKSGGVNSDEILNQTITKTDLDTTVSIPFGAAFHITANIADSAYVTANTINDTGDVIRGQIGDSLNLAVRKTGGNFTGDVEFDQNAFHIDSLQADSAYVTANTINDTADVLRGLISGDTLIFNASPSAAGTEFSIVQNMIKVRPGVGFSLSREDSTSFDLMRLAVDTATLNTNWKIATTSLADVATSANGIKTVVVNSTPTGAGDDQKVLTYFNTGDTLGWKTPPGAGGGSEDSLIFNESESATGTEYAIMSNLIKRRPGVGIDFVREDSTTFDLLRTSVDTAFLNANWEIATAALAAVATSANGIKTVAVNSTPTGAGDNQKVLTYFETGDTLGWTLPSGSPRWLDKGNADTLVALGVSDTLMRLSDSANLTTIRTQNSGGFQFLDPINIVATSGFGMTGANTSAFINNTGNNDATWVLNVVSNVSGDATVGFRVGGTNWIIGADNTDDNAFVLSRSSVLGTSNVIKVTTSDVIQFNSAYTFPTADGGANEVLQTSGGGALSFAPVGDTLIFNESPSATGTEYSIIKNLIKVRPGEGFSITREDSTTFDLMRLAVDTATLNTNWEIATAALAAVATSADGIKTVAVNSTPTGAGDDQKVLTYFNTGDTLGWKTPTGGSGLLATVGTADTVTLVGVSDTLFTVADTGAFTSFETQNASGFVFMDGVDFQANITILAAGTIDGVDLSAFDADVASDSASWNATADALGTSIESGKITTQTILNDDMDTTAENFAFDGAFHITSNVADSAYITANTLNDTADALRDGDTWTGVHDFGGATSFELPNANDPTTSVIGQYAGDANNFALEGFDGTSSYLTAQKTYYIEYAIDDPDVLANDSVTVLIIRAEKFPFGIELIGWGFELGSSQTAYTMNMEHWTNADVGVGTETNVDAAIATSTDFDGEDDGTFTSGSIAVGSRLVVLLPDDDIDKATIWIAFSINGGN